MSVLEKSKAENKAEIKKKSLSSNPIMEKSTKSLAHSSQDTNFTHQQSISTNPLANKTKNIVAKINNFNTYKTNNRLFSGGLTSPIISENKSVDYADLIQELHEHFIKNNG